MKTLRYEARISSNNKILEGQSASLYLLGKSLVVSFRGNTSGSMA